MGQNLSVNLNSHAGKPCTRSVGIKEPVLGRAIMYQAETFDAVAPLLFEGAG